MTFKKGTSGNAKGRPRGSTNEKTKYIREWVISLIGANAQNLQNDFKRLPVKERFKVITSLMPYVLPKQTEASINAKIDLNLLTDEQLDEVINEISESLNSDDYDE